MGFTETWLTYEQESLYLVDGFKQFYVSRINKKGAEISLHVKESLFSNELAKFRKCNPNF